MMNTGLEGVVAATTRLSHVDGERGELVIAGFPVEELAEHATFEETTWLLWHGDLPSARQLSEFRETLGAKAALPPSMVDVLRACARRGVGVMDALSAGLLALALDADNGPGIVARVPAIIATYWRLLCRRAPVAPRPDLGYAGNFLFMIHGRVPNPEEVRGLETYLNTVVDHGLNASTFAARVITSTGSDLVSSVVGAIGALKGPLHGGAPAPALDMILGVGEARRAEAILRQKLESGGKLIGFGHRVYKVRDPRADVLAKAAERLFTRAGDMAVYTLARSVEADALRLLAVYKPGRRLQTNVEFYTALLLHGLGFDSALFAPVFAMSRVSGWIAQAIEQRLTNRLIRPHSEYAGPRGRTWVPLAERDPVTAPSSG